MMAKGDTTRVSCSLRGTLLLVSGLHIGCAPGARGSENGAAITRFVRDHQGRPFIPGSTLRGAIRFQCERGIRAWSSDSGGSIWTCDPIGSPGKSGERARIPCSLIKAAPCSVCGLFGSKRNTSRLWIRDLNLSDPWSESLSQIRSTLGISRSKRIGIDSSARQVEMIPAGLKFSFEVLVSEPEDWELGLLFWAMDEIGGGICRLGGGRRLGLGHVALSMDRLEVLGVGSNLKPRTEVYLPKIEARKPKEEASEDVSTKLGIRKPSTDDMSAVVHYCLRMIESEGAKADAGEIGKTLAEHFGLTKKKRQELGLPEKVSGILDTLVADNVLQKTHLGRYGISPGYTPHIDGGVGEESVASKELGRLTIDEFAANCKNALIGLVFPDVEEDSNA
ncbi:hypothetical protein J7M28_09220 [bacterium]|nr:hypothetical protein [bacterium]